MPGNYDALIGPDLARIELGDSRATADAIFYLLKKLEEEAKIRARDDRQQGTVGESGAAGIRWLLGPWVFGPIGSDHAPAVIRPPQLTANQNNYNPPGFETCIGMELESDASRTITGFNVFQRERRCFFILNRGTKDIVFSESDAGSLAANQLGFGTTGDTFTLPQERLVWWQYDVGSAFWRLWGIPAVGGSNLPPALGSAVLEASVSLTADNIRALDTTYISVVSAPAATKYLNPVLWTIDCDTTVASGDTGHFFELQYNDAGFDGFYSVGQITADLNNVRRKISVGYNTVARQHVVSTRDPRGKALAVRLSAAKDGTGTSTAKVVVYYTIVTAAS